MRRLLKFLHTLGAVGLMGSVAVLLVLMVGSSEPPRSLNTVSLLRNMARVGGWVLLPSMAVTIVSGLLSIAVHAGFHEAGWAWLKAATGVVVFEGTLHVVGAIQETAKDSAGALASSATSTAITHLFTGDRNTLWVLLALSIANIALGVWRPRLPQLPI